MHMTEADVRRIVREEVATLLGSALRRPPPVRPPALRDVLPAAVAGFSETLPIGEHVSAAELWTRFLTWASAEVPEVAGVNQTVFGKAASRCPGLVRGRASGCRVYMRRTGERGGCTGAAGCQGVPLKYQTVCADHYDFETGKPTAGPRPTANAAPSRPPCAAAGCPESAMKYRATCLVHTDVSLEERIANAPRGPERDRLKAEQVEGLRG